MRIVETKIKVNAFLSVVSFMFYTLRIDLDGLKGTPYPGWVDSRTCIN